MLNLHYGLIHNGLPTQIDINESSLPTVKAEFEPRKVTLCEKGDIAFADASEDTNDVGKVVEFADCAGKDVVCGLHTIHGRDKLYKTVPGFKGYAFSSKQFHDQIKRIAQGTKVFSISAGSFDEVSISIPGKDEQKKIAALLFLIDQRISIQSKVIEKYESLIKALCHNLIISSNGTVCHIGDILKIGSGKDYKHLTAGSVPVFGTGGYMLSVSDWLYEGESVCIGRKGTINNPFYVDGKFWTVDTLFYTYDFKGVLPKYCYYLFQTIDWLQYTEASGVPSLSKSTIERIQISIPSIDEQAKAVQVLDSIEMAITCWTELLNHDESIKQYLLSQLFI